jgi:hypothetical protein
MSNVFIGIWKEINYLIIVFLDLITFKIVFVILLLALLLVYKIFKLSLISRNK